MRTPMNAIISFSDFGRESASLTEAVDYHSKIHFAGQYLLQLINDSLSLSKIEYGKYILKPEAYRSAEFVQELRNILEPKAEEKGVALSIHTDAKQPLVVLFDKIRLQQIFVNLLNNAIKFTQAGGHVSLEISHKILDPDRVQMEFVVKDDGIGMSEDFQKNHLFKPFEQERVKSDEPGTGLGLSIVKELVEMMHGTIECESKHGEGTMFKVVLTTVLVSEDTTENSPAADHQDRAKKLEGKKVLMCEDHPLNREIATHLLQKKNMLVDNAEDGKQGVELFEKSEVGEYAAILMDIRMPVMDGIEATRVIRTLSREDAAKIPIIALSANAFEEDVEKCRAAGMNAHVAKPIKPEVFYRVLEDNIV